MGIGLKTPQFILFLTKKVNFKFFKGKDVLKEKITKKDNLKKIFPEYKGGQNYENALNFITEKFLEVNKGSRHRITIHYCVCVDQVEVHSVFKEILESSIQTIGK